MRATTLLAVLATAGVAHAQAPGQVTPAAAAPSVTAAPWTVSLALGSEGLTPKFDGASNVQFLGFELSGRYRFTPAIEVALSLFLGGSAGQIATSSIFADFRYHFFPEHAWSFYALGGLGVLSAHGKDPTDTQKKGRGALRLGLGGDRRFGRFSIFGELYVVGAGDNKDAPTDSSTGGHLARDSVSGGALELGAAYSF